MLAMYGSELVKPFKSGFQLFSSQKLKSCSATDITKNAHCSGKRRAHIRGIIYGLTNAYFLFSCKFSLSFHLLLQIQYFTIKTSSRCNCVLRWGLDDAQHRRLRFDGNCHHEGLSKLFYNFTWRSFKAFLKFHFSYFTGRCSCLKRRSHDRYFCHGSDGHQCDACPGGVSLMAQFHTLTFTLSHFLTFTFSHFYFQTFMFTFSLSHLTFTL